MCENVKIMCANKDHQEIICHFIEQIKLYMDEITENDEDFNVFMNVLHELIEKSNQSVIFSFLGGKFTEKWINELPTTIYYAVIGYMHLIDVSLIDLIDTVEKLNNLVADTMDNLEYIRIDTKMEDSYYKINLN